MKIIEATDESTILVTHHESDTSHLEHITRNKITISDKWNGQFPFEIYHLLYTLVHEKQCEKGLYSVHGACVSDENSAYLLIGHSGAGKSTISLDLIQHHQMKMLSGNKTIVSFDESDHMIASAGTTTMTIRGDQRTQHEKLLGDHSEYYGRIAFELVPELYEQSIKSVKAIIIVRIASDYEKFFELVEPTTALHTLYSYFMDKINNDAIMFHSTRIVTHKYHPDVPNYLIEHLQKALAHIPVYKANGSLDFISSNIVAL